MRFHFKCSKTSTTIIAPPVMMKIRPSDRSVAHQWKMYHETPRFFDSVQFNVEEVILNWGNRKAKLKPPFHYINFEFEGYGYFVEQGEEVEKMQETGSAWKYIPLKITISLSEHQFNLLSSTLDGKYLEHI